jgi:protein phosphatase
LCDDLGLLVPAEVDQYSGYRRYAPSQLGRARLVAALRLLGMPLARIKHVVDLSWAHAAQEVEGGCDAIAEVAPEVSASLPDQPTSGTTLTAVVLAGSAARIRHVGDARVWLVRLGALRQLTHDHTIVAALLETGQLTTEEARSHDHRSLLSGALTPGVVADETTVDLGPGDRLVLTTDGVHSHLDDLTELLATPASPQQVADRVAAAVAAAGEPDNHTIVVVDLA